MDFIKIVILALLISISNEGSCSTTTIVEKYTDCRDKKPHDERNNVCCYLKGTSSNGEIKRCVELRRVDIDGKDTFKKTKESIKSGAYDYWLLSNYTGFEEYRGNMTISEIDSLRCNDAPILKLFGSFAILLLLFLY